MRMTLYEKNIIMSDLLICINIVQYCIFLQGAFVGTLVGIALITWITAGQYTSPNVRKPVPLPSAPVDQCSAHDILMPYNMTAENSSMSYDMTTSLMQTTTDGIVDNRIPLSFYYFTFTFILRTFEFKCSASITYLKIKKKKHYIMLS